MGGGGGGHDGPPEQIQLLCIRYCILRDPDWLTIPTYLPLYLTVLFASGPKMIWTKFQQQFFEVAGAEFELSRRAKSKAQSWLAGWLLKDPVRYTITIRQILSAIQYFSFLPALLMMLMLHGIKQQNCLQFVISRSYTSKW